MSTHALIGAIQPGGKVRAVYLHSDGYPSHAGRILAEHFATPARLAALLALGDLSVLAPAVAPPPGQAHNFTTRARGVCLAYGRDGGERVPMVRPFATAADFWQEAIGADGGAGDFAYLFCPLSGWWARCKEHPTAGDTALALLLELQEQSGNP